MKGLTSRMQLTQCPGNEWGFPKAPWVPVDVWSMLISMKWWVGPGLGDVGLRGYRCLVLL